MKRLLCVSQMDLGGAETFLMKLYRNLDRTRYQFDFCESPKPGYYDKEILELGGRIFRVPLKTKSLLEYKKAFRELIAREGYKYVFRASANAAAYLDLKLAKEAGAMKCIARSTNTRSSTFLGELAHQIGKARYLKYVDLMFAPSVPCGEYTFGRVNVRQGNVKILHNGLDVGQYRRDEEFRAAFRKEYGWNDSCVIGHIGRFEKQKNHLFLVKVFNEIKKFHTDARLLLIGKGSLYPQIVQTLDRLGLSKDTLILESRNDVNRLYSVMDVLVFPSLYEGLPNVVVEAQAANLPCVVSDSITTEVVDTGLVRQLSLNQTPQYWAEKVLESVNTSVGDAEKEVFDRKYDIKKIVNWFQEEVFER